ncbi:MAG: 50S ribosomal protein L20 [Planctomycetes bacterium]|nr:50S ribosomal protein L20 [Planctomycetota bacterium]
MRVTNAVPRHRRKKRIAKRAKGFVGGRRKLLKVTKETILRADRYAFRDRKQRKRHFRSLWITRISAAARINGMNYSQFMNGLLKAEVTLDRKQLAEIAVSDPQGFASLVETAKSAL